MPEISWKLSDGLEAAENSNGPLRRAQGIAASADPVPQLLREAGMDQVVEVVETKTIQVRADKRTAKPLEVDASVEVDDGADYLMVVRHPSGALTFHGGDISETRRPKSSTGRRGKPLRLDFNVPIAISAENTVRRSLFSDAVDAVVDAVVVKIKDMITEKAVDLAELAVWKKLGRKRGLVRISVGADGIETTPVRGKMKAGPKDKALLFLHGTFSTTRGSFGSLAQTDFFCEMKEVYGDAIYGLEHFTVSVSPEQNATDLIKHLPAVGIECDVVTHSRGGLVLRNLVERASVLANGDRFKLGKAVLVASPNEGTQLATPDRWNGTIGWIANLLDLFPPNPLTSNAAMLGHWITWFVKIGVASAEGLDAMNITGQQIKVLQSPPSPSPGKYSALVSNHEANEQLWARALDLGLDWFFEGANDLVVPTIGGWRIDHGLDIIPPNQIGMYGPGGNISPGSAPVGHTGFFDRPETARFLVRALKGLEQDLPEIDPALPPPVSRRSAIGGQQSPSGISTNVPADDQIRQLPPKSKQANSLSAQVRSSVFELIVMDPARIERHGDDSQVGRPTKEDPPFLYAAYGGARVMVPFPFKKAHLPKVKGKSSEDLRIKEIQKEVSDRWGQMFGFHRRIQGELDNQKLPNPLSENEMRTFGELLFKTLFPDNVRRLFDVARSRETDKLFVIFTSMIPWVFDMPWEFALDVERGTFLATEDLHFIRNVLTPTPVETLRPQNRIRMLVATAVPSDLPAVSADEEAARLRHALQGRKSGGLIEIDALAHTTVNKLHQAVSMGSYDVVHFIGHGFWNKKTGQSGLVLENAKGKANLTEGRALREILSGRGIRMVFLNACDTGRSRRNTGGDSNLLAGVAQDLFSRGVPNVIANQFPVGDDAAVAFAQTVYTFLAAGQSFAQAVREARIAANYETGGHKMDWAIPVAYARDPEDRLVRPQLKTT